MKISKNGYIKEMQLESYEIDEDVYLVLYISQSPFGDLAIIKKEYIDENGFSHKNGYKSTYFDDSTNDIDLFNNNIDGAKEWYYNILGI